MRKLIYIIGILVMVSCSGKNEIKQDENIHENPAKAENISLTEEQIQLAGIETGKLQKKSIAEVVECTGVIEALPQHMATVSPLLAGFINQLNYYVGDFVEKGSVLATLSHPDFIELQQKYMEAKSQVNYYKEEFKRQGELTVENAASIKKMQKAKADFFAYEANYKLYKSQLELLGLDTEKIEKGEFVKYFKLKAPISGNITQLNANNGKFVNAETGIYEIININEMNIILDVYEKDIPEIKKGQKIKFTLLNNGNNFFSEVKRVGVKIDDVNRTTKIQGFINNKQKVFKPGMYVNASVYIKEKEVFALPLESVVKMGDEEFLFIKKGNEFLQKKIVKGIEQDNCCEIINPAKDMINAEIVTRGAYYLKAELEAEE